MKKPEFGFGSGLAIGATMSIVSLSLLFGDYINGGIKAKSIRNFISDTYYEQLSDDELERIYAKMYNGMLAELDSFCEYYTPEEAEEFRQKQEKQVCGIGVRLNLSRVNNTATVREVIEGSPAQKSGLKVGDRIISIDGTDLLSLRDFSEVHDMIRGDEGSELVLGIVRDGMYEDIKIKRAFVDIPSVEYEVLENNIGYLHIWSFNKDTSVEVISAVNDFKSKGVDSIILDLRSNTGGLVDECIKVAEVLFPSGLVYTLCDRSSETPYYSSNSLEEPEFETCILVNGMTASASEILASFAQDNGYAKLVGEGTFGKGCGQTVTYLKDGSSVKITTMFWKTPNGNSIMGIGLTPDFVCKDEYLNDDYILMNKENSKVILYAVGLLSK